MVANPARDCVRESSGQALGPDRGERPLVVDFQGGEELTAARGRPALIGESRVDGALHVRPAEPQKLGAEELPGKGVAQVDASCLAREPGAIREAGCVERSRGDIECEPVDWVAGPIALARDPEADSVK